MADIQANFGEPGQLPYGVATTLNKRMAATRSVAGQSEPTAPASSQAAPSNVPAPAPQPPTFKPATDEEKFLFGPTKKPGEPVTFGASVYGSRLPPPADLNDFLPALRQAALMPDAPPQIQALLALITYHAGA